MKPITIALSLALLYPVAATAQEGVYLGFGYGLVNYDISASDWPGPGSGSVDDSDTGYKIFAGYQPNRFLSIEAAYVDLGETTFSDDERSGKDEPATRSLSLVARVPVLNALSVHGRVGAHRWKSSVTFDDGSERTRETDSATDLLYGIGATLHPGRRFGIVLEWERYTEILGTDVDLYSVSGR
ncbi:porin family protein, partial [Aquisalimonas sp.]|uniref:porin family protein n=1 Tax=Aquisalimonas sp. TaxID=1872621 RepID=UPI0025B7D84B